ncbi:MAG: hypothetical protein AAF715_05195 [Myxococcota bacterium]
MGDSPPRDPSAPPGLSSGPGASAPAGDNEKEGPGSARDVSSSQGRSSGGAPKGPPEITRGLPSVSEARAERRRLQSLPPRVWLWAVIFIGVGIVIWWRLDQAKINEMRTELLARQRAVKDELGPRWDPLRERLERWTTDCAEAAFTDVAPPASLLSTWDFRTMPGIYLRLAQSDARSTDQIRDAANASLKDAFTACLLTATNANPLRGTECQTTRDCPRGQMCNEFERCTTPSQPYNLRTAYKSLSVLDDAWVAETQEVTNELTMRGLVGTFDDISAYDLPLATDLLNQSKYFLVVIDEPAEAAVNGGGVGAAEAASATDEDERGIPTADHPARVCLYRLDAEADNLVFRLRRMAAGALRGPATSHPESAVALKRQANSCALALEVKQALGVDAAAVVAPEGSDAAAGSPSATASAVPGSPPPP